MNKQISMNSVLTDFGLLCRAQRIRHNKTLADQATAMNMAPSEIVQIETSVMRVPKKVVLKFTAWLKFDLLEHPQILKSSLHPRKTEKVFEGHIEKSREAWRGLNGIPSWSLPESQRHTATIYGEINPKQSGNFELPQDLLTLERTFEQIEKTVRILLRRVGAVPGKTFDLLHFIECQFSKVYPHFALLPVAKEMLPKNNVAITRFREGFFIKVREEIYLAASRGDARARHVIAHEMAHMIFHRALPKSLMDGDQERLLLTNHADRSVELQAERGAICILAPREFCVKTHTAKEIQSVCNIPYELAELAANEYGISRRTPQPYEKNHLEIERKDALDCIESPLTYKAS